MNNTQQPTSFTLNSPRTVEETIDGETVVIDTLTGKYFTLSSLASWVWNQVIKGYGREDIAALAAVSAGVSAREVESFCNDLLQYELITACTSPRDLPAMQPPGPTSNGEAWSLTMRVYRDMEDLIALDPIHEIDTTVGWPYTQPQSPDAR